MNGKALSSYTHLLFVAGRKAKASFLLPPLACIAKGGHGAAGGGFGRFARRPGRDSGLPVPSPQTAGVLQATRRRRDPFVWQTRKDVGA